MPRNFYNKLYATVGVQLLCLIGKGLDACRYLTSYGLWERAAWLAKSVLPQGELGEVLKKWAEHLAVNGNRVIKKISCEIFDYLSLKFADACRASVPFPGKIFSVCRTASGSGSSSTDVDFDSRVQGKWVECGPTKRVARGVTSVI